MFLKTKIRRDVWFQLRQYSSTPDSFLDPKQNPANASKNLQATLPLTQSTAYTSYPSYLDQADYFPSAAAMQYTHSLVLFRLCKEHKA